MPSNRYIADPQVAKALTHPLRVSILGILEERTASPREIADELDAPLGVVSYHVRQLARSGLAMAAFISSIAASRNGVVINPSRNRPSNKAVVP